MQRQFVRFAEELINDETLDKMSIKQLRAVLVNLQNVVDEDEEEEEDIDETRFVI